MPFLKHLYYCWNSLTQTDRPTIRPTDRRTLSHIELLSQLKIWKMSSTDDNLNLRFNLGYWRGATNNQFLYWIVKVEREDIYWQWYNFTSIECGNISLLTFISMKIGNLCVVSNFQEFLFKIFCIIRLLFSCDKQQLSSSRSVTLSVLTPLRPDVTFFFFFLSYCDSKTFQWSWEQNIYTFL